MNYYKKFIHKILISILVLTSNMFANEYYAVVQPVNTYNVKSSVSGTVVDAYTKLESKIAKNNYIVKIDTKIDRIDLQQSQIKLDNLKEILKIENGTLKSFNKVSSKSKFDKDNQQIKVLNIVSNISDMKIKVSTLKDRISKKNIKVNNLYISNISVRKGDYVNPGTLLYTAYDLKQAKLEIFVPIKDAHILKEKTIYINDKKTNLKINKMHNVADSKHISSYKCEIILNKPTKFSEVLKVSFK
ncbi:MAG TPA: HlyD family secretion protein [Arcobacter sp.]|nr:HlyD family secretion protein [Arcobacter sp.]